MGDDLLTRVARDCARHALLPDGPVLLLVSGGADSMCLMDVVPRIHRHGVRVLSVDHGLRPAAAAEAREVVDEAARRGIPARVATLGLRPGPAAQERARDARLAAARRAAAAWGCAAVATGHTAGDQAETVLFRLARGTGRTGALGMGRRDGDLVRPLLGVTREETRDWCARHGIRVVDDPANADAAYTRVRVRHGLLPALAAVHPGADRHVAAFADLLRDEAEVLDAAVDAAWERCAEGAGLAAAALAGEHPAVARLLVRRLATDAGLPGEAREEGAVRRVLDTAAGGAPTALPGGGRAALERGVLVVSGPRPAAPPAARLGVPGEVLFGAVRVTARRGHGGPAAPGEVALRVDGPLTVRAPLPGDRVALAGGGRARVGRLLAAAGVPARARHLVPVVAERGRVLWVAGYRAAADRIARPGEPAVVVGAAA